MKKNKDMSQTRPRLHHFSYNSFQVGGLCPETEERGFVFHPQPSCVFWNWMFALLLLGGSSRVDRMPLEAQWPAKGKRGEGLLLAHQAKILNPLQPTCPALHKVSAASQQPLKSDCWLFGCISSLKLGQFATILASQSSIFPPVF